VTREQFDGDDTLQFAVMYLIQIVGEAAYRLSAEARVALPQLPWNDMINMRHRLVHGYGVASRHIVWQVARDDLPVLIARLERFLT
jgi:uncharacterized protein with HEPN domain